MINFDMVLYCTLFNYQAICCKWKRMSLVIIRNHFKIISFDIALQFIKIIFQSLDHLKPSKIQNELICGVSFDS